MPSFPTSLEKHVARNASPSRIAGRNKKRQCHLPGAAVIEIRKQSVSKIETFDLSSLRKNVTRRFSSRNPTRAKGSSSQRPDAEKNGSASSQALPFFIVLHKLLLVGTVNVRGEGNWGSSGVGMGWMLTAHNNNHFVGTLVLSY